MKLVYNKVDDIDAFTGGVSESSISDGVVGKAVKVFLSKTWWLVNGLQGNYIQEVQSQTVRGLFKM